MNFFSDKHNLKKNYLMIHKTGGRGRTTQQEVAVLFRGWEQSQ